MRDPRTFWLTVTNIILGLAVVVLIVGILTGTLCDLIADMRRRHAVWRELDQDMRRLFHPGGKARR